jgi:hypothetical protein
VPLKKITFFMIELFDIQKRTRCTMLIRVMYSDGRFDMVKPDMLDNLLDRQVVTSFKRNSGWAVVGRDAIRSSSRGNYRGMERRLSQ